MASVCTRLEGLPLAIELAAARTGLFSPEAMLKELEHRLNLLTGGPRDLPERQRTLRSTIEWSYDLLNHREQELFGNLAVFVGGCTVEAVEALYHAGDHAINPLDGLQSLVDKNLLSLSAAPRQKESAGGRPRFVMLETISEYAFERLRENAEAHVVHERHAGYFLHLLEETEPLMRGPQQIALLNKLEIEHDNIRAALRWALETRSTELGLRLVGDLRWFWTQHSHYTEGLLWARAVLALHNAQTRDAARARALWSAGALASTLLGVLVGGIAGYAGGLVDDGANAPD